jgi:DNA helicase-2/ATP-dependent DNA helicase PcrA
LKSKIVCYLVGDCRQATYFTTCSPKYKKYKGKNIINLFNDWNSKGLCTLIEKNECYRSNQIICDFADSFYPNLTKTTSFNNDKTGHDGLFIINEDQVLSYVEKYNPTILRWDKSVETFGLEAKNFGTTKGQTFERVLIFPTEGFRKYLSDGKLTKVVKKKNKKTQVVKEEIKDSFHLARFYVATTRAKQSVAFVFNGNSVFDKLIRYEE